MIPVKRAFFHQRMVERMSLGGGVEAMKGVYQSIRAGQVCGQGCMARILLMRPGLGTGSECRCFELLLLGRRVANDSGGCSTDRKRHQ